MLGIVDVGGGMRGIFSAGIYDCMIDRNFVPDYCIGVSAGSANLSSFIAHQKGRTYRFYTKYSQRKDYMSFDNFIKKGYYLDLDYIYSTLSNADGEDPLYVEKMQEQRTQLKIVTTSAQSGKPVYFDKNTILHDDLSVIKASCCLPFFCKTIDVGGSKYYDGGVSDPIPLDKAIEDGCDKIIVVLTKPKSFRKRQEHFLPIIKLAMKDAPKAFETLKIRHELYNASLEKAIQYEKEGKAIIIAPEDCYGVDTLTKDVSALDKLYKEGYDLTQKLLDKIQ